MSKPTLIDRSNLSLAWADAYLTLLEARRQRLSPLVLTFTGFDPAAGPTEIPEVRDAVDAALAAAKMQRVQTIANTIFPQSLWLFAKGDRKSLYEEYLRNLPDYVAMQRHKNGRGLYFGRLIGFDVNAKTGARLAHVPADAIPNGGNQLEFIIEHCRPGVRHSMFQASIFDPARDLTAAAQLGFPCLQHLTFVPDFKAGTLEFNAFYATQQLFEKGYGNLLGLSRLGIFVAGQVGLVLSRVTCFAGIEKMEEKPPAAAAKLLAASCADATGRRSSPHHAPSDLEAA